MSTWTDINRRTHNIADMTMRYRQNCMNLMRRQAPQLAKAMAFRMVSYASANAAEGRAELATEMAYRGADALLDALDAGDIEALNGFIESHPTFVDLSEIHGPAISDDRVVTR